MLDIVGVFVDHRSQDEIEPSSGKFKPQNYYERFWKLTAEL